MITALLSAALMSGSAGDLPPCPGINPDIRRTRGSNCLGILLHQCGADRLRPFFERTAGPNTRNAIVRAVGHSRIRWIAPGQAVTQDLRPDRLNAELDGRGRIAKFDCY
jgi:hypothetical protein